MFATASFRSLTEQLRTMVPSTAILRLHDKDWVFVPVGGNRFRRVEVQAGAVSSGGFQVIENGLSKGDKVVANALQFSSAAAME
jgi:cobalt-zinc-cadmium efflux system membrane fusion protein